MPKQVTIKGVSPELSSRIEAAARAEGLTKSAWMRRTLANAARGEKPAELPPEAVKEILAALDDFKEGQKALLARMDALKEDVNAMIRVQHRIIANATA